MNKLCRGPTCDDVAKDYSALSPKERSRMLVLDPSRMGREQLTQAIRAELIRPDWIKAKRSRTLFLNRFGDPMHPMAVWQIVNKAKRKAGLEKAVSPHAIRHSCAAHMVQARAPLRHV